MELLRGQGMRMTPQRLAIVNEIMSTSGYIIPTTVIERVRSRVPGVSPSTVYRTLELLEDLGVVTHTHLGHGAPSYHLATHADHIHLVCKRCGDVQTADVRRAQQLADEVAARYGFVTDVGHLSLDGMCAACAGGADATGTKPAS